MKVPLFGTDGIRNTANNFPMTPDVILRVGQALGFLLRKKNKSAEKNVVLIGKDTRLSGYMVEMALSSGLNSMGVNVLLVGPLPTPGIAFLTQSMRADAGIVISASHNPYGDNGIKIFGPDGYKISRHMESEVERLVFKDDINSLLPAANGIGRSKRIDDSQGRYIVYAKNAFPMDLTLEGLRIVLDCANGAAYKVGPAILQELGAELIVMGNSPDGTNINDECGALYPERMAQAVLKYRADVGVSLDGDADRVVMVDHNGHLVNGDRILAICAIDMKKSGTLSKDTIVTTEMSNFGLERLMKEQGIHIIKTNVGDKYVVEEMRKNGYVLGGESSGHVIFLDSSTTGDGMIAALKVLAVMKRQNASLNQLNQLMQEVPQVLRNVKVRHKKPLDEIPGYSDLYARIAKELNGDGRVFVRFSGTEPLVRILVEGVESKAINEYADEIAQFLQKELS